MSERNPDYILDLIDSACDDYSVSQDAVRMNAPTPLPSFPRLPRPLYVSSLHSADPGTTGADEISDGGYTRRVADAGMTSRLLQARDLLLDLWRAP